MSSKTQTLRIIMRNNSPLYIYDVVNFRLPHDEDYWVIERSNSNHIFINADEVIIIGFDEDLK